MTKEEALQKVNAYCAERQYTNATLTDKFKDKFAEHFAQRYEDTAADDENAMNDLKFALNTAFSGASLLVTDKNKEFESKENDYKSQIAELTKKVNDGDKKPELSEEVQNQLKELEKFRLAETKKNKFNSIMEIAKKNVRKDFYTTFEKFAKDYAVTLDGDDKEQAEKLVQRFQDVMQDSIGDIKPFKPRQEESRDEEYFAALREAKINIKNY